MENSSKRIYSLIDYYSAVVDNVSINDVFALFNLNPYYDQGEFAKLTATYNFGGTLHRAFRQHGLLCGPRDFDAQFADFQGKDIFSYKFQHVSIVLSGSGLAELRAYYAEKVPGFDLDQFLACGFELRLDPVSYQYERVPDEGSVFEFCDRIGASNYHVTRCDFAFDLVNYKPEFLDEMMEYCRQSKAVKGTEALSIVGFRGAPVFEIQDGRKKVCYIGTSAGANDRLLRVYDKRKENLRDGVWKDNPLVEAYDRPDSWIRIEFQCRREWAERLLFSKIDDQGDVPAEAQCRELVILKYIYTTYSFRDLEHLNNRNIPHVAEFWKGLWNWDEIPSIIQNLHIVKFVDDVAKGKIRLRNSAVNTAALRAIGCDVDLYTRMSYSYVIYNRNGDYSPRGVSAFQNYLQKLFIYGDYKSLDELPNVYYSDDPELSGVPLVRGMLVDQIEFENLLKGGFFNNGCF